MDRIAYTETHYGQDRKTYQNGSNGGIWRIDQRDFKETQKLSSYPSLKQHFAKIKSEFGINWSTVRYEDLHKPLYSGLAARLKLLIVTLPIPTSKQYHRQAVYLARNYKRALPVIVVTAVGRYMVRVLASKYMCCMHGKKIFIQKGAQCHTTEKGRPHKQGPNLANICGRPAAQSPGYLYTDALKDSGIKWDKATLDQFLQNPKQMVPGTKMVFAGIRKKIGRKCLVDYICGCI